MSSSVAGPLVNLNTSRSAEIDTDVLFVPVFEGEEPYALLEGLNEATVQAVKRAILGKEFQAKPYELFILQAVTGWKAARVALIGCGPADDGVIKRLLAHLRRPRSDCP